MFSYLILYPSKGSSLIRLAWPCSCHCSTAYLVQLMIPGAATLALLLTTFSSFSSALPLKPTQVSFLLFWFVCLFSFLLFYVFMLLVLFYLFLWRISRRVFTWLSLGWESNIFVFPRWFHVYVFLLYRTALLVYPLLCLEFFFPIATWILPLGT